MDFHKLFIEIIIEFQLNSQWVSTVVSLKIQLDFQWISIRKLFTQLDVGGCKTPPISYFCDSPKEINGKSCHFFTFPKYIIYYICMEDWGLLFKVRKHLVCSGVGQSGQTCPEMQKARSMRSALLLFFHQLC